MPQNQPIPEEQNALRLARSDYSHSLLETPPFPPGGSKPFGAKARSVLRLAEVRDIANLRHFLALPASVYRDNPYWVPHLRFQTVFLMGSLWSKEKRFWLVFEGDRPIARMGAKIHRHGDTEALHFGFFECEEGYPEAAEMLVAEAHAMAPQLSMKGPYHFRMEDPYTGLLIEGFEQPPCFWSAYNPPYYQEYLERAGLEKAMDLWSYFADWESGRPRPIERRAQQALEKGVRVRQLDASKRWAEITKVATTMNEALKDNWGFEDFSSSQVWELYFLSFLFLHPRWLFLAECRGETAGACIVLPDYNPWIKETGGRLTLKLLKKLLTRRHEVRHVRAWGLGVLEPYRPLMTAPALIHSAVEYGRSIGVRSTEISWVLESNIPMNAMLRAGGARRNRIHRILEKGPL